jgi:hypothetical protein
MKRKHPAAIAWLCAGLVLAALNVSAQAILSTRAGLVYYVEGEVAVEGPTRAPADKDLQLRPGERLLIRKGKAEVLVTPGALLRLGDDAVLRMRSTSLEAPELELEAGSSILEVDKMPMGNSVRIRLGDAYVVLKEDGLYRLDYATSNLRVYGGKADVLLPGARAIEVHPRFALRLQGKEATVRRFDSRQQDALHAWAASRSFDAALENVAAYRRQKRWRYQERGLFYDREYNVRLHSDKISERRIGEQSASVGARARY